MGRNGEATGLGTTTEGWRTQEASFGSYVPLQQTFVQVRFNSKCRTPELAISVELQEYIQGGLYTRGRERPITIRLDSRCVDAGVDTRTRLVHHLNAE